MSNDIMTMPVTAHISILRRFIERERSMRLRVLKGETQRKGLADADEAMASLTAIEAAIRKA
ncbi:MAG: hypothetical protein K8U57_36085 [Planctomycetes bacterium]|nr:hypothetical protein [Planctomycetota bacterium]